MTAIAAMAAIALASIAALASTAQLVTAAWPLPPPQRTQSSFSARQAVLAAIL
eukprot:m.261872 g.261872  ORF g.261872 m.261872 type:complete len:53 (-) comp24921_c0_seq1:1092-1250(-)